PVIVESSRTVTAASASRRRRRLTTVSPFLPASARLTRARRTTPYGHGDLSGRSDRGGDQGGEGAGAGRLEVVAVGGEPLRVARAGRVPVGEHGVRMPRDPGAQHGVVLRLPGPGDAHGDEDDPAASLGGAHHGVELRGGD